MQFITVISPLQTETFETQGFQFKVKWLLENFSMVRDTFAAQSLSPFSPLSHGMFNKSKLISCKFVNGKTNLTSLPQRFICLISLSIPRAHEDLFTRSLMVGVPLCCEANSEVEAKKHAPTVDRTTLIPVDTSLKYLKSQAYKQTYGNKPVWSEYRRNHKGAFPPLKTRKTCIRGGKISTGNPCPICRDEYLVLHHENVDLLNQFISPHTGEVLSYSKTGLCQKRHMELLVAVEKAKDYGFITFDVPFRKYDYSLYYKS